MMGVSLAVLLWSASFWCRINKTKTQTVAALFDVVCPCEHLDGEYARWY